VSYGTGGKVAGFFGKDTVKLGDAGGNQLVIPNVIFGQVNEIDTFFEQAEELDGVLGLGFAPLAVDGAIPLLDQAINEGLLDQPIFTVYITENGVVDNAPGGMFTYGGLDTKHCSSQVTYYPLTNASFFQIQIGSVTAGGLTSTCSNTQDAKCPWTTIIDTSTGFIGAPQLVADNIADVVNAIWDADDLVYYIDCKWKADPIQITIGSNTFTIPVDELIISTGDMDGRCYWAFMPVMNQPYDWVLGAPFLRTTCTIFDYGQKRVGFADIKS